MGAPDPTARTTNPLLLTHPVYNVAHGWDVLEPYTTPGGYTRIAVVHDSGLRRVLSFHRFQRECELGAVLPPSIKVWVRPKRNQYSARPRDPQASRRLPRSLRQCPQCGADLTRLVPPVGNPVPKDRP